MWLSVGMCHQEFFHGKESSLGLQFVWFSRLHVTRNIMQENSALGHLNGDSPPPAVYAL